MDQKQAKEWLLSDGFQIGPAQGDCEFFGYRRSRHPSMPCETNEKKSQIEVRIHSRTYMGDPQAWASVTLTRECGDWFNLQAYGFPASSLPTSLPRIERALADAWNAVVAVMRPKEAL